jgi:hypothetical protein
MDIKACINCERNLRIFERLLYCKPCNYIYYIDTDVTDLNAEELNINPGEDNYPVIFKHPDRVFRCCKFVGYSSKCCDPKDCIKEDRPFHLYKDEPIYFDLDTMICKYELYGCSFGSNTIYWKNSEGLVIREILI